MLTMNFQMFKLELKQAEEAEIKLKISAGSLKKQESSRKMSTSAFLTTPKPLTVWITTNCGKFFKRWEYQTSLPSSLETCTQVKKQQLELDMEQGTGSTRERSTSRLYIVTLLISYLTSMQSTSCEMPGWMTHKLESRQPREISTTSSIELTLL